MYLIIVFISCGLFLFIKSISTTVKLLLFLNGILFVNSNKSNCVPSDKIPVLIPFAKFAIGHYIESSESYKESEFLSELGLDKDDQIIGYKYVHLGKMMDNIKKGIDPKEAIEKASGTYGRFDEAVKKIDPRKE